MNGLRSLTSVRRFAGRVKRRIERVIRWLSSTFRLAHWRWILRATLRGADTTLVVAEPSRCHAEVILGLVETYRAHHQRIVVLLHEDLREEVDPEFAAMGVRTFYLPNDLFPAAFRSIPAVEGLSVIVNTSWDYTRQASIPADWGREFASRDDVYWLQHDLAELDRIPELATLWAKGRLACIVADAPSDATVLFPLGPEIPSGARSEQVRLLVPATTFQDFDLLLRSIVALRDLVGVAPRFDVVITGDVRKHGVSALLSELELTDVVALVGRVPNAQLYDEVERAHFLVSGLQTDAYAGRRHSASGARQLSLDSLTPAIVPEQVLPNWGLRASEAIAIRDNDVVAALHRAVTMREDEYADLQHALTRRRDAMLLHNRAAIARFLRQSSAP